MSVRRSRNCGALPIPDDASIERQGFRCDLTPFLMGLLLPMELLTSLVAKQRFTMYIHPVNTWLEAAAPTRLRYDNSNLHHRQNS